MLKRFEFAHEIQPDRAWLSRFKAGRAEAERWYLGARMAPPPTVAQCRAALVKHMPELLPQYDRVCALVGDDERAHQILSHYRPAPEIPGCSHAVWHGDGGPALVRNYDFNLDIVTDRFEATSWFGREVIAKAQRPWGGCLDGMNQHGLVASLTFGGSPAQGLGFSIILILRYVLETCRNVGEAITALSRIPIAQSHNVTVLDKSGRHATLFLGPNRTPMVTTEIICTNHQEKVVWPANAQASLTVERHEALARILSLSDMTLRALIESFLAPPLYSRRAASPTVYTAVYRPVELRVDYLWPSKTMSQNLGAFQASEYTHDYGELAR